MREYYNIEDRAGRIHRVLVLRSIQHDPYERQLHVSARTLKRVSQLTGPLYVAPPTPYRPRAIFILA